MCLITFAYCNHPTYRLILVANRDEFYQRPSLAAHHWPESPHILAGIDQQGGGTWLGITRNGRFAAVTNFRQNPQIPAERSRGELPVRFLSSEASPNSFAHQLQPEVHHYGGFNLLLADNHQMTYCSNRSAAQQTLEPGIHSLSNHLLNTPWPKTEHSRDKLSSIVSNEKLDACSLMNSLSRRTPFDDADLPQTGIDRELERMLSPPFIVSDTYGTRCTTALLWQHDGHITFAEQSYLPGGEPGDLKQFEWQLEQPD